MPVRILRLESVLFSLAKMTSSRVTWLLAIIITVQGQGDSNTMRSLENKNFSCRGRDTGFYADINSNCEVYHTCDNHGNKFTYYCPKQTKFCQETLVCDHAHLVNCKNAEKLITEVASVGTDADDKVDKFHSSSMLSRSFKITPEPSIFLEAPRENSIKSTTFTMSSTVFLRDSKVKKNDQNRMSVPSTTKQPFQFNHKSKDANEFVGNEKTRNVRFEVSQREKNLGERKTTAKPFYYDRGNYPYSETLRSMHSKAEGSNHKTTGSTTTTTTTTAKTTTAGTEFPIPAFNIDISAPSGNEEDPYYPKHFTSTEIYYTLEKGKINKPLFSFSSTEGPFSNGAGFKIPDVLPDLNSVDDLVDRRKILYIPKIKLL